MTFSHLDAQTETFVARTSQLQRVVSVRLATLRQIVQRSASLAFGRETGLSDFDWLVVWFIGARENPVAADVSDHLQRDKGQVSRAVARLTAAGVLTRDHLRGPLRLTPYGRDMFERIGLLVRTRNEAMLQNVTAEERVLLDGVLDKLFRSAAMLLEQERRIAPRAVSDAPEAEAEVEADVAPDADPGPREVWRPSRMDASSGELIVSDLYMLLRLLRRSADLGFSRVTGLSNFDWRALSHIEMREPLTLSDLIVSLDRNKSQVGRAVERLAGQDLVERRKVAGLASVSLSTTAAGKAAYDVFLAEARRRHDLLVEELTGDEYDGLESILDRLTQNALGLLAQERAVEANAGRAGRARAYASGQG